MQPENKDSKATLALVLSDECLLSKDLSKSLFGRVKQFAPLANIRKAVEAEGIPFKLCSDNTFKHIATKDFWIRAKEAPGWVPDFIEENDDEEQNDDGGFNPKEGTDVVGIHTEESDNIVNMSDHNAEEVNNTFSGNCTKKNSKEDVSNSVCSGHFKTSMVPRIGGLILSLMDELVKVGQVMGYKMDGCMSNMTGITESQGVKEVNFLALQETKMENMELFSVKMCWGNFAFDYVHSDSVGEVVIMGDFNEVRYKSDRFGSVFNVQGANVFNSFITNARLEEVPLGMEKKNMLSAKNIKAKYKDELEALEAISDKGDESLNIRGIMVDGMWIESLNRVKGEFFHHFSSRFDKLDARRAHTEMRYPKTLTCDQQVELESDVSNEEMKRAVWDCGIDKSPGPDVFTFGCNSSFIALILKIPDANTVKEFRPISLIGSLYKIVSKILANRLAGVLGDIVNEMQLAFIAGRQILDGPFILNEVLQWCKIKKKQSLIFKVDFEKAYDSIRWDFLDDILKNFGFGKKWCKWIQSCLRSLRGSIIINGSPTKEFQFFKGLKQGDPLSPFLFILIMESLHLSFQQVVDASIFKGIKLSSLLSISHMFYTDDADFVVQWCDGNYTTLVYVLECFYRASGLRINMSKSKIMGVFVDSDKVKCVASKVECLILKTLFSYLGSKVGGSMSRVHTWNKMVDRVKNRLSKWKMKMLSIGGRLTLLKSVLGSMPIFHMSIFRALLTVLRTLESIRSQLFKGQKLNSKKASWVRVIKVIHGDDGKVRGYVKDDAKSCWLSIVNEISSLKNKGINLLDFMQVKLGNGDKTAFWEDIWIEGKALKNWYLRIYILETCNMITVGMELAQTSLDSLFRRVPRGGVEQEQFDELSALVHDVTLTPMSDRWIWTLKSSGDFSVASIRKVIDDKSLPKVDSKNRWIKYVPIKVKVHAWKVKTDSLPTRFNASRRVFLF
nr:RNA-directed DNA polymerase, eukaryota [Tanacetum cinerariifolium]